jgi:energy-coupling factor transporter ATP-binding protein EcfA2
VDGLNTANVTLADLVRRVGLVFQNPYNQISGTKYTVREEVAFGLENLGLARSEMAARVDQALELTGLAALAERSPFALSGGQQQRLALAAILVMRPPLLVLDEPTSQLDPQGARELFQVLASLAAAGETAVVLAEHKLEGIAAHADRLLVLAEGRLVADGPPAELLASDHLESWGLRPTAYTQAARLAAGRGLLPAGARPPVTLEQAVEAFRWR